MKAHLLFGRHDILVAWSKDFVDLGYAFSTIGHCTDGLNASGLEQFVDTSDVSSSEDGGVYATFAVGRCAEHNFATSGNLGGCGKHEHSAEERSRAARDIKPHFLDGHALLPAGDARSGLHTDALVALSLMEPRNVLMSESQGVHQLGVERLQGLLDLFLADS